MACGCNKIAAGLLGIAKSKFSIGLADDATIEQRRVLCRACPEAVPCKRNVAKKCTCRKCGCSLKHKTRLKDESCPLGKWQTGSSDHAHD